MSSIFTSSYVIALLDVVSSLAQIVCTESDECIERCTLGYANMCTILTKCIECKCSETLKAEVAEMSKLEHVCHYVRRAKVPVAMLVAAYREAVCSEGHEVTYLILTIASSRNRDYRHPVLCECDLPCRNLCIYSRLELGDNFLSKVITAAISLNVRHNYTSFHFRDQWSLYSYLYNILLKFYILRL